MALNEAGTHALRIHRSGPACPAGLPVDQPWASLAGRAQAGPSAATAAPFETARLDRLGRLPAEVLRLLACFEQGASLATLSALSSKPEHTAKALAQAVAAELVCLRGDTYHFLHAALRQLVYQRIPAAHRAGLHLRIGRQLLAGTPEPALPAMLFTILEQLNPAVAGMPMRAERERCAHLNLQAGERARAHGQLEDALAYFDAGLTLLAQDRWQRSYALSFELQRQQAASLLLLGRYAPAGASLEELGRWAASAADRAGAARLKSALHVAMGRPQQAFAVALAQVAHAGLHLARPACARQDAGSVAALWSAIAAAGPAALGQRGRIADPELRLRLGAMADVLQLSLRGDAGSALAMLARILNATLEHGNSDAAPLAYVALAALAGRRHGQAGCAVAMGRLALALARREGLHGYAAAVQLAAGQLLLPWHAALDEARAALAAALETALVQADPQAAAAARHALAKLAMFSGAPLAAVQGQLYAAWQLARHGAGADRHMLASRLGLVHTLRGDSAAFGRLDHADLDEQRAELAFAERPGDNAAARAYWLHKLQARYYAGDWRAALRAAAALDALPAPFAPALDSAEAALFCGLAHAAAHAASEQPQQREQHLQALIGHHNALAQLGANYPASFAAMNHLLEAETAHLQRHDSRAMHAYEQAIIAAAGLGMTHCLALAHELAARHYAQLTLHTAAAAHCEQARLAYLRWGALGKARQLESQPRPCQPEAQQQQQQQPAPAHAARVSAMGQFAASIAHEVTQPLAAIVLNAGAGLNWLKHEPPNLEMVRSSLQTIATAGTRAAEIIRGMRRLADRSGPELASVVVDEAITDVLALLRAECQCRGISVATALTLARHVIHADRAQLQQVVMNLLLNAMDALLPVSARARELTLRSALADDGGTLRISVEDNGVGLAPEQAPHVFEPLVSSKPDGMGMGLAICRAIVEAHGGRIWFTARQPHGTAFHVSLPAQGVVAHLPGPDLG